jgi:hypothetical protein
MKFLQFILHHLFDLCLQDDANFLNVTLVKCIVNLHYPFLNLCLKHNLVLSRSAEELFIEYNPSEVAFQPPVPVPKKIEPRASPSVTIHFRNEDLFSYVKEVSEKHVEETVDFSLFKMSVKS